MKMILTTLSSIKRTTVYSILTAMMTGFFVALILVSQHLFNFGSLWVSIIGAFLIALVFQPLRDFVETFVNRVFFRARYDYQYILGKASQALRKPMGSLDRFSQITAYLLWKTMRLSSASIMVLDRKNRVYTVKTAEGAAKETFGKTVDEDSPLISAIIKTQKELDRNKLAESNRNNPDPTTSKIIEEMDKLKTDLIIPCISESEHFSRPTVISTINLGKKLSGFPFSGEDVEFLKTLANQSSITIEYAYIFDELKTSQEQVVKAEKLAALGTTIAGIAHELKNPITYLTITAQCLAQSWDNPDFKQSVQKMLPSEVERMKLIIDGLSDYSKTHETRSEPVDLAIIIEKVIAILGYDIKKSNVQITKNYADKGANLALGDKDRLIQVFMNLVSNAIQATDGKNGKIDISIRSSDKGISVSVSDNGIGMSQETIKKIFDPFFTTKEIGTGLGLSITKKIIDEHKGSLLIDSQPGKGTAFTVCLPRP